MKKIALITGATAGIGKATAILLAKNNYNIIITGRRNELLEELKLDILKEAEVEVLTLNFDVRENKIVEETIDNLPEHWRNIDVLVNNAGLALGTSKIQEGVVEDWDRMIDTNVKGLVYISRKVSKIMAERNTGHIVNISSIAGREAYPGGSVYCGSKHAVKAISKSMRLDLLEHGIKVTSIDPGMVNTEFSLVRFKGDQQKADNVYIGFDPLLAQDIAETILFVVTRPAHVNIDDLLIMPTAQGSARDVIKK